MTKKLLPTLVFFPLLLTAQPGQEAWHWYFGMRCALDFSSGTAVAHPGPPLVSVGEGCASISDEQTGQFLLANFGNAVMNKNLVAMQNGYGLYGVTNSTQGSLIIPKPGSKGIYYVFTNDYLYGTHGVHYSVVDMNQLGGLGKVTLKNQVLTPPHTTEKMVAVKNCNGSDYWVITMPVDTNIFNAYLVTSAGISTTPVVSSVGAVLTYYGTGVNDWPGCGYLKASPNGKKLALGSNSISLPILEILDFDNVTGIVSNPTIINYPGFWGPYGLTFSPDNSKLYASAHTDSTSFLYQYDLSSGVASTIISSQTLIAQTRGSSQNVYTGNLAAMQMAPDGKIYIARNGNDTLPVINNPNALGAACNFQLNGIILPGTGFSTNGLPNFVDANYAGIQLNVPDIQQCNTFTVATVDAGSGYSSYQWSTGAATQTISISAPGQYWVTVTNDQGCQKADTMIAYVVEPFKIDTAVCDSFSVSVSQGGASQYNWNDNYQSPVRDITISGDYYVDITYQSGCSVRDSLSVGVVSSPKVDLGPSLSLCDFKIELNAFYPGVTFNWSTGATTPTITVNEPGTYWVTLHDRSGCIGTDTLVIGPPWQLIDLLIPNIVTPNGDKINDEVDFARFQFSAFTISIYNRWGQKVFESESTDAVWKPNGDDGTYFYTGQYKINCGKESQTKNIKGYITLAR